MTIYFKDLGDPKYTGKRFRLVGSPKAHVFTICDNGTFRWCDDGSNLPVYAETLNREVEIIEDQLLERASEFCRTGGRAATMNCLSQLDAVQAMLTETWNEAIEAAALDQEDRQQRPLIADQIRTLKKAVQS